jgi:hypothetical protein
LLEPYKNRTTDATAVIENALCLHASTGSRACAALVAHGFDFPLIVRVLRENSSGQSPEDDLLLQVQGIVAEYERARKTSSTPRRRYSSMSRTLVSIVARKSVR